MKKNRIFIIALCACILLARCSEPHHNSNLTMEEIMLTEINDPLCAPGGDYNTGKTTSVTITKSKETTAKRMKDVKRSTEFIDDYTHKYYYNTLTDTQKAYYRYCFNKKRYSINGPEPNYSSKDKDIAYYAFQRENPHLQLYPTQYQIDNKLASMTPKKRNKILNAAKVIADKAGEYERTFDKIKVIHDELRDLITYESYKEMESAFLEGKADCSGYADAFCVVCQLAGIDCIVVWGTANNRTINEDHAWNMVKIGDDWYNVDVCWDDVRLFTHAYFLRTDKAFSTNHTVKMPITCPKATKRYPVDQYGNEAA